MTAKFVEANQAQDNSSGTSEGVATADENSTLDNRVRTVIARATSTITFSPNPKEGQPVTVVSKIGATTTVSGGANTINGSATVASGVAAQYVYSETVWHRQA